MRTLVVDDDRYFNKLLSDHLILCDHEVQSCLDGETALELLEKAYEENRAFDLIIVDMLLPKLMGAELLTKINENARFDQMKKVAISGIYKDDTEIKQISMLHSIERYWVKPFDLEDFVHSLSEESKEKTSSESGNAIPPKGSLNRVPIEGLFFDAYNRAFTGRLHLLFEERRRRIYFLNGHPVSADSAVIQESLGESLIQMGYISDAQRQEASRQMVETGKFLGESLIELGHLSKDDLFKALRRHSQALILRAFLSRQGNYEFEKMNSLPSHIPHLEFNPFILMMRAQRKFLSDEALRSLFEIKNELYPAFKDRFFQILSLLNLEAPHEEFLRNLESQQVFAETRVKVKDESEEEVLRALYLFESIGLLEWSSEAPSIVEANSVKATEFQRSPSPPPTKSDASLDLPTEEEIFADYMDTLNKNFFELLDISPSASEAEIDEAYRKVRFQKHPDRYGDKISGQTKRILDDILSRLDSAYQTLGNPESREEYLGHLEKSASDSASDSKRYLSAQEIFRQALQELNADQFEKAIELFDRAHQTWKPGVEYRIYKLFAELKSAIIQKEKDSVIFDKLKRLRELAFSQASSDVGFLLLGHAYRLRGDWEAAIEAYRKCLQVNEHQEEASNALAHLAGTQHKKSQFGRVLSRHWKVAMKNLFLLALVATTGFVLYKGQDLFIFVDPSVDVIDVAGFQEILPAQSIRAKAPAAKIIVRRLWIVETPDAVLHTKCRQLLNRLQAQETRQIFLIDQQDGLKAYCDQAELKRF